MAVPLVGQILNTLIWILNYQMESWSAEFILLAGLPTGLKDFYVIYALAIIIS